MTKRRKILVIGAVVISAGAGIYEARQASTLQTRLETLQKQQLPLSEQIQQLRRNHDEGSVTLAALQKENDRLRAEHSELLRLRSEVGRLQGDALDLAELKAANEELERSPALKSWLARVAQLKEYMTNTPGVSTPELQYVSQKTWLEAARDEFKTDEDYRRVAANLRMSGGAVFAKISEVALRKYIRANGGQSPKEMSQLKPYFDPPIDDALLQRYEFAPAQEFNEDNPGWNYVGPGNSVIITKAPVDKKYDVRNVIGANSSTFADFAKPEHDQLEADYATLAPVIQAYKKANYGLRQDDLTELVPYLTTDEQRAALEKLLDYTKSTKD